MDGEEGEEGEEEEKKKNKRHWQPTTLGQEVQLETSMGFPG